MSGPKETLQGQQSPGPLETTRRNEGGLSTVCRTFERAEMTEQLRPCAFLLLMHCFEAPSENEQLASLS